MSWQCVKTYACCHVLCVQTKIDITSWGTLLLVPTAILILLVFIGIFWVNRIWYLVIAGELACGLCRGAVACARAASLHVSVCVRT